MGSTYHRTSPAGVTETWTATSPRGDYPRVRRSLRSEVLVEVATLDILSALTCPLQGDTGILAHTPAVEFCP
jgi:hypothetical protein